MAGVQTCHCPFRSLWGAAATTHPPLKRCRAGTLAAAISWVAFRALVSGKLMFDCPEQIHTSPTTTFETTNAAPSGPDVTVNGRGSRAALSGSSRTRHFPSGPAEQVLLCPANATVTDSPGMAVPQMGTAKSLWSTRPSLNSAGILTAAWAQPTASTTAAMQPVNLPPNRPECRVDITVPYELNQSRFGQDSGRKRILNRSSQRTRRNDGFPPKAGKRSLPALSLPNGLCVLRDLLFKLFILGSGYAGLGFLISYDPGLGYAGSRSATCYRR